jgi:transcriptional regulator with XRE-family HTH domain
MREEHEIGPFIRDLRKARGMTMTDLAARTGFSQGFLSKVETSKSAPSVSTLIKIANALDVRLSYIFGEFESETTLTLVKKNERKELARNGSQFGYRYEALAPQFLNRRMDPYVLTHPAHTEISPIFQHEGQEMIYVLEGKMRFLHGTKEMIVEEGDCLYFDARIPHHGEPLGDADVKFLLAMYTPESEVRDA